MIYHYFVSIFSNPAQFIMSKGYYQNKEGDLLIVDDIKDRWKDVTHSIEIYTP